MAIGQFEQDIRLWDVNQDPKDSKESPLYSPGTLKSGKMGPHRLNMEGLRRCNTFYPHSSQSTRTQLLDSLLISKVWKKTEENTQYTCQ